MAKLSEPARLPAEAAQTKDHIEEDSARMPIQQCAKCGRQEFKQHQKRLRWFLPVVEHIVYPIHCLLVRWCCTNCGTTFIQLSSVCVSFKRYLRGEIEARSQAYAETEPMSYRKAVTNRGSAVVYDGSIADAKSTEAEKEKEAARALAPSTVHRWIGSIAALREKLQPVVRLARQIRQGTRLSAIAISASKYRSAARKRVLEACGLLLRAVSIVSDKNITDFATGGSSP